MAGLYFAHEHRTNFTLNEVQVSCEYIFGWRFETNLKPIELLTVLKTKPINQYGVLGLKRKEKNLTWSPRSLRKIFSVHERRF